MIIKALVPVALHFLPQDVSTKLGAMEILAFECAPGDRKSD